VLLKTLRERDTAMTSTFMIEELEARFEMLSAEQEAAAEDSDGSCSIIAKCEC
jgi:hypothetical protein